MGDLNPKGAAGNAAAATVDKGELLLASAAGNLARLVADFARFAPG
jgi:creatinine amidohydrolase